MNQFNGPLFGVEGLRHSRVYDHFANPIYWCYCNSPSPGPRGSCERTP